MGASPYFKVYTRDGAYIAACCNAEDAAAVVALNGDGATIRAGHRTVVWQEGKESQPAGESYDHVADVIWSRVDARHAVTRSIARAALAKVEAAR